MGESQRFQVTHLFQMQSDDNTIQLLHKKSDRLHTISRDSNINVL